MQLGLALPSYGSEEWRIPPNQLLKLAQHAEEKGFAGLWVTEHLRRRPDLGYSRMAPISTIATIAGATETIPLGTSILILPMRNPVLVAQHVSTIHHLSGHRLQLGLGAGWLEAEYEVVNVPFDERGQRFTEGIKLLQRLLVEDTVTFKGDYYEVDDFRLEPKLDREPQFLLAGTGTDHNGNWHVPEPVKARIHQYGDGWIGASRSPEAAIRDWGDISEYLSRNDDDPGTYEKLAIGKIHLVPDVGTEVALEKQRKEISQTAGHEHVEETLENSLTGSVGDIKDQLQKYKENGFDQIILSPLTNRTGELNRQLEYYSEYLF